MDLRSVVSALGPALVVSTDGSLDAEVDGLVMTDPLNQVPAQPGCVLLAAGFAAGDVAFDELCREAARAGAAAVAVKGDRAVTGTPVPVLVVDPTVDWAQVVVLVRAATAAAVEDDSGTLFDLAEAVAGLCEGPIVMHDAAWELLAYSGGQPDEATRHASILDRRAPRDVLTRLRQLGVTDLLARGEVVHLPTGAVEGLGERYAVGVVVGGHFLGTIWALPSGALDEAAARHGLRRAAEVAALPMLRHATAVRAREAERDAALESLLSGGRTERLVAERLGVEVEHGFVLAGLRPVTADGAERVAAARRLLGLSRSYLEAYRVVAAAATTSDTLYLVFPSREQGGRAQAVKVVTDLHARLQRTVPHRAMISSAFPVLSHAAATRAVVDELLELAERRGWSGLTDGDAVQASWRLEQFREVALAHPALLQGPIMRLVEYDRAGGGDLIPTLRAWFEAVGDTRRTAERLDLHVNTVRYRLRRAEEVAGLDLGNPDERLLAELQVRLLSG